MIRVSKRKNKKGKPRVYDYSLPEYQSSGEVSDNTLIANKVTRDLTPIAPTNVFAGYTNSTPLGEVEVTAKRLTPYQAALQANKRKTQEQMTEFVAKAPLGGIGKSGKAIMNVLEIPQKTMTYGLTGKYQLPSEAWGYNNPKGFGQHAVNLALDVAIDVPLLGTAGKLAKGKKLLKQPIKNFKSEIDWGKWNKEIPKDKTLMQEYNAIDYKRKPLSDKEKELYQWLDEEIRFAKLPQTTNKQSIEVLDNFKQRIRTPEGQKRLKELGITEEQFLQNLKIVEDPNTYGYYRIPKNTIAINPNHPLPKKVVRHEIEHGVQNALKNSKINKVINGTPVEKLKALESTTTEIDDILSGLTLRKEGTPNKVWSKINTNEPVNINDYKSLISNKQNATDYFLTGSKGAEKSAFLAEVQQYMMDTGKIPKDSYVKITPEMVKETMVDAMFDEKGGGKYLRLFNIIKAEPKNYEIISKGLNKMLTVTPLIGAGAYMQNNEYKNGGTIGNNGMFDMTNPNIYKGLVPAAIATGAVKASAKNNQGFSEYQDGGYIRTNKRGRVYNYSIF